MTKINIPTKTLTAVRSGRKVRLPATGLPTVLIFHTPETVAAARMINETVREKYRRADEVLIASVADLHIVPGLLRGMAEGMLRQAYDDACKVLPDWMASEDYLLILPDWDGKVTRAVGGRDLDQTAVLAVLDGSGGVLGVYQGADSGAAALDLLAQAFAAVEAELP